MANNQDHLLGRKKEKERPPAARSGSEKHEKSHILDPFRAPHAPNNAPRATTGSDTRTHLYYHGRKDETFKVAAGIAF